MLLFGEINLYVLFFSLDVKILCFEYINDFFFLYVGNSNFSNVFNAWKKMAFDKLFRHNGLCGADTCDAYSFIATLAV